ncbi:MAG: hypothetical protein Fur0044_26940 [Anaerolineae bacterium]|nr:hypothetical protein [Anaerolineales bacterium]
MIEARKLSFQEVWDSSTVFFVDEELEGEIERKVAGLLQTAQDLPLSDRPEKIVEDVTNFLIEKKNGLDVILKEIGLSDEKFKRIVTLLRKLKRISGDFESEWSLTDIKRKIIKETEFAKLITELLVDGKRDQELAKYIPRYYLETLNYREVKGLPPAARNVRYKTALIGTYGGRKGYYIEGKIQAKLEEIKNKHGISYGKGMSRLININTDFAIPTPNDPWVIIMSTFQETTGSGQTNKTRDLLRSAYQKVIESNSRHKESRIFVNFVDGGGWLARKSDLERLVNECDYFLNLQNLDMLEAIVLTHVPKKYFQK